MKIFGIGFHKTGTTSLIQALKYLQFNPAPYSPVYAEKEEIPPTNKFNAFADIPWFLLWNRIAKKYPEAYFILTYRSEDSWIESVKKHFGFSSATWSLSSNSQKQHIIKSHALIYGEGCEDPESNAEIWLKKYRNHNNDVQKYFYNHNNFLELNICDGEGWEKICPFLNKSVPNMSFPHWMAKNIRQECSDLVTNWSKKCDVDIPTDYLRILIYRIQELIDKEVQNVKNG